MLTCYHRSLDDENTHTINKYANQFAIKVQYMDYINLVRIKCPSLL